MQYDDKFLEYFGVNLSSLRQFNAPIVSNLDVTPIHAVYQKAFGGKKLKDEQSTIYVVFIARVTEAIHSYSAGVDYLRRFADASPGAHDLDAYLKGIHALEDCVMQSSIALECVIKLGNMALKTIKLPQGDTSEAARVRELSNATKHFAERVQAGGTYSPFPIWAENDVLKCFNKDGAIVSVTAAELASFLNDLRDLVNEIAGWHS